MSISLLLVIIIFLLPALASEESDDLPATMIPEKNPYKLFAPQDINQTRGRLRNRASAYHISGMEAMKKATVKTFAPSKIPQNGPFIGQVIMSYSPEEGPPPGHIYDYVEGVESDKLRFPWIVVRVEELMPSIPNPAKYDPNGSARQQYLYWSAVKSHFEVGICFPEIESPEYPQPNPGDRVLVTYTNSKTFSGGRYKVLSGEQSRAALMLALAVSAEDLAHIFVDEDGNVRSAPRGYRRAGWNFKGRDAQEDVKMITLHSTAFDRSRVSEAGAQEITEYWAQNSQSSTHFEINSDGTIVWLLDPFLYRAWHGGTFNPISVGIDLSGSPPHNRTQINALKQLVQVREFADLAIVGHYNTMDSDHGDPGKIDDGNSLFPWWEEPFVSRTSPEIWIPFLFDAIHHGKPVNNFELTEQLITTIRNLHSGVFEPIKNDLSAGMSAQAIHDLIEAQRRERPRTIYRNMITVPHHLSQAEAQRKCRDSQAEVQRGERERVSGHCSSTSFTGEREQNFPHSIGYYDGDPRLDHIIERVKASASPGSGQSLDDLITQPNSNGFRHFDNRELYWEIGDFERDDRHEAEVRQEAEQRERDAEAPGSAV